MYIVIYLFYVRYFFIDSFFVNIIKNKFDKLQKND